MVTRGRDGEAVEGVCMKRGGRRLSNERLGAARDAARLHSAHVREAAAARPMKARAVAHLWPRARGCVPPRASDRSRRHVTPPPKLALPQIKPPRCAAAQPVRSLLWLRSAFGHTHRKNKKIANNTSRETIPPSRPCHASMLLP